MQYIVAKQHHPVRPEWTLRFLSVEQVFFRSSHVGHHSGIPCVYFLKLVV